MWSDDFQAILLTQLKKARIYVETETDSTIVKKRWPTLLTILDRGLDVPKSHRDSCELIYALHPLPAQFGDWERWEDMLRFAVAFFDKQGEVPKRIVLLYGMIDILVAKGQLQEALDCCFKLIHACQKNHMAIQILGSVAGLVATICDSLGHWKTAIPIIEQLAVYLQKNQKLLPNQEYQLAWAHINLQQALFLKRQGLVNKAIDKLDKVQTVCSYVEDTALEASVSRDLATLKWLSGQYEEALELLNAALVLYEKNNDAFAQIYVQGNMGLVYWSMGLFPQAEAMIKTAITESEAREAHWRVAYEVGNLGYIYLAQGFWQKADVYFKRQQKLAEIHHFSRLKQRALASLGDLYLCMGKYKKAIQCLEKCLAFYAFQGPMKNYLFVQLQLAYGYAQLHQFERADFIFQTYQIISHVCNLPIADMHAKRVQGALTSCLETKITCWQEGLTLARLYKRPYDEVIFLLLLGWAGDVSLWQTAVSHLRQLHVHIELTDTPPPTLPFLPFLL